VLAGLMVLRGHRRGLEVDGARRMTSGSGDNTATARPDRTARQVCAFGERAPRGRHLAPVASFDTDRKECS
jgi:hypothetical protein